MRHHPIISVCLACDNENEVTRACLIHDMRLSAINCRAPIKSLSNRQRVTDTPIAVREPWVTCNNQGEAKLCQAANEYKPFYCT